MNLVVRTHQDAGVRISRRGRIEGDDGTLGRALGSARLAPMGARLPRRRAGRAAADAACYFDVHEPGDAHDPRRPPARARPGRVRLHQAADRPSREHRPRGPGSLAGVRPGGETRGEAATNDLRPSQGYLDDPPDGIGAAAAWTRPGGRGQGVRIIDVEGAWRFSHEDLIGTALAYGQPGGRRRAPQPRHQRPRHARRPPRRARRERDLPRRADPRRLLPAGGPLGQRPRHPARRRPAAPRRHHAARDDAPRPEHAPGRHDAQGYVPVSYWPDDLTAIQYATALGILVVEAAGNGAQHLDDDVYAGPGPGFRPTRLNPFVRDGLDSGGILVGAGAPPSGDHGPDRSRLPFSNWGTAIDAQGWGRDVATTGSLGRRRTRPSRRTAGTRSASAARRAPRRWWPGRSPASRARSAPPATRRSPPGRRAARCARRARRSSRPPTAPSSPSATAPTSPS